MSDVHGMQLQLSSEKFSEKRTISRVFDSVKNNLNVNKKNSFFSITANHTYDHIWN